MELPSASGRLATDAYLSVNDQQQVPVQKQDLQGTGKRGSEGRVEALREKKILEEEKAQNMGRTCRGKNVVATSRGFAKHTKLALEVW